MTEYDAEEEITLQTLQDYLDLHDKIEDFLREKCRDYNRAKWNKSEYSFSAGIEPEKYLITHEIKNNELKLEFFDFYRDGLDTYDLPIDILFDDDFYSKMKAIFDEKRRNANKKQIERELRQLEELKKKYERK